MLLQDDFTLFSYESDKCWIMSYRDLRNIISLNTYERILNGDMLEETLKNIFKKKKKLMKSWYENKNLGLIVIIVITF